mgnify:FL=1
MSFIGKKEISSQEEKNGRIYYNLSDGSEGSATERQFKAIATKEEGVTDDQLTLMIQKHDQDILDVLTAIHTCNMNYNEVQFVIQRVMMTLTELQEKALCEAVEKTFGQPMNTITDANKIPISELNDKVKK